MFESMVARIHTPTGMLITFWLILGITTLLFKPRTAEAYAKLAARNPVWFFARWAAFLQFLGGFGLDPLKVAEAIMKMITGTYMTPEVKLASSYPGKIVSIAPAPLTEHSDTPIPEGSVTSIEVPKDDKK